MVAACAQELKQFNQAQYALNKAIELDDNQSLAYQVCYLLFLFLFIGVFLGNDTIR